MHVLTKFIEVSYTEREIMKHRYVLCDVIRCTLDFLRNYNLIIVQMIILLSLLYTCTGVSYLQNGIIKITIAPKCL